MTALPWSWLVVKRCLREGTSPSPTGRHGLILVILSEGVTVVEISRWVFTLPRGFLDVARNDTGGVGVGVSVLKVFLLWGLGSGCFFQKENTTQKRKNYQAVSYYGHKRRGTYRGILTKQKQKDHKRLGKWSFVFS